MKSLFSFLFDHLFTIAFLIGLAYLAIVHYHVITKLQALEKSLLQKAETEADVITSYVRSTLGSIHNSLSTQIAAVPIQIVKATAIPTPAANSLAAVSLKLPTVAGTAHSV